MKNHKINVITSHQGCMRMQHDIAGEDSLRRERRRRRRHRAPGENSVRLRFI